MALKDKLNQIRLLLGMEVKFATEVLVDGTTTVEAEKFEPGFDVFIVNADGTKTPAPAGTHELSSGILLEVDEAGKIMEVSTKTEEVSAPAEGETVEAAALPTELPAETLPTVMEALQKCVMAIETVSKDVADIKTEMANMKQKMEKFAATPGGNKVPASTRSNNMEFDQVNARVEALQNLMKDNFFNTKK